MATHLTPFVSVGEHVREARPEAPLLVGGARALHGSDVWRAAAGLFLLKVARSVMRFYGAEQAAAVVLVAAFRRAVLVVVLLSLFPGFAPGGTVTEPYGLPFTLTTPMTSPGLAPMGTFTTNLYVAASVA